MKSATKEYLEKDLEKEMRTGGGRWRRLHKTELDGDKWPVARVPSGATRHKYLSKCVMSSFDPVLPSVYSK